jgi:hypothetical protein
MDEGLKGMFFSLDRSKSRYKNIIEFVNHNGLDLLFEDMYGRNIADYIDIFGLAYHNGNIADEIILGLCEGGLSEPRKVRISPDYSLEIIW